MLLHVETNQFSGFSFWLQYPMAEERTSAQTAVFRNTDGRNQISNIVETSLAGTKKKREKKKKVREYRETLHTRPMGYNRKKCFQGKLNFFIHAFFIYRIYILGEGGHKFILRK